MNLLDTVIEQVRSWTVWEWVGFAGQGLFFGRFFVQWLVSEMRGESHIPLAFWFFSIAGGTTLFVYACHIRNPVFIAGQGGGLLIYLRNLTLIYRKRKQVKEAG
jgi:lipid-A-disaccharide synthase-like uncharacterized protein